MFCGSLRVQAKLRQYRVQSFIQSCTLMVSGNHQEFRTVSTTQTTSRPFNKLERNYENF